MSLLPPLLVSQPTAEPWFWAALCVVVGILLVLNVGVFAFVYARRLREAARARHAERFLAQFRVVVEQLTADPARRDLAPARKLFSDLDELERPLAATALIEQLRISSPDGRARLREGLRQCGATDLTVRGTRRRMPWRRTLAIRTLGWIGDERAVPALLARLDDRNRHVRDASVRALGRVGDPRALPALERLFLDPERNVSTGFVYEALVAFGDEAAPVFREGLVSADMQIRVASCFGIGFVLLPERSRPVLEEMLDDPAPAVRAAALETLGRIGGRHLPARLAHLTRDEHRSVRRAAAGALGGYDDPRALEALLEALADPDRDTVIRAGESLIRLTRLADVGAQARAAAETVEAWPIDRARVLDGLGAL